MSVCGADLYGLKLVTGPAVDLSAVVQGLLDGDLKSAQAHLDHLSVTAPKLAKGLTLDSFRIPCAECAGKPNPACKVCGGKLLWTSPEALRFLQSTFRSMLDNGEPVEKAWPFAWQMFSERRALVLSRQSFAAVVFRMEPDGMLLRDEYGETFFLAEENPEELRPGTPVSGCRWPIKELSHSYLASDGSYKSVAFYVRSLWWDY